MLLVCQAAMYITPRLQQVELLGWFLIELIFL
jgi:hypothetical protein